MTTEITPTELPERTPVQSLIDRVLIVVGKAVADTSQNYI